MKGRFEEKQYGFQLETYRQLLEQMDCAVIEYDTTTDTLNSTESFERIFHADKLTGSLSVLKGIEAEHPEFGFDELYAELEIITETKLPSSFESVINFDSGKTLWINIVLLPILGTKGEVSLVFAAVQNASAQHSAFDTALSMINQVPGGIHRCHLSDPIHLEYVSAGLTKMLGYTESEFNEIVGEERNYCNCIVEEDRDRFDAFCTDLAKNGGTATCEYRLIDKSGNAIYVSDTMDAKRATSGIMYGYSVVTDMSQFQAREKEMQLELKIANEKLDHARLKVSTSQMQPHFLYNSLASIREIMLENPQYASDLLCDFTTHLRACIRSMSNDDFIQFSKELENIKAYVNIERMRFGEKLQVLYDIGTIDFEIIPLSIQPLVENAIRHGIYEQGAKGGTVKLSTVECNEHVVIAVEDNGVGFEFEHIKREIETGSRDSTGLFNLIYRFKELMGAEVRIMSEVGKGTRIEVILPKEASNENNCGR